MARKDVRERKQHKKASEPKLYTLTSLSSGFHAALFLLPFATFPAAPRCPWLPVRTAAVFLPPALRWERADWLTPGAIRSNPQLLATKLTFPPFFFSICPLTNKQTVFPPNTLAQGFGRHSFCVIVTFCCYCCLSVWNFRSTVTNEGGKTGLWPEAVLDQSVRDSVWNSEDKLRSLFRVGCFSLGNWIKRWCCK